MALNEHVEDLLPAFALGCLDEGEAVMVKEHLASCPVCRAELRSYQEVAGQLSLAMPQVEPPARVKGALMDRIQAAAHPVGVAAGRPSAWRRWRELVRQVSPVWSLASLVLIVILAASNVLLWNQVNELRSTEQVAMRVINLIGTDSAPGATGLLVVSLDGQHGTLVVDELPDLDQQQQYQLWLIDQKGNRTSGGVFSVKDGYGSIWVGSPQPLISYPLFGVTVEPWGGSPAPTGEKVLGGEL